MKPAIHATSAARLLDGVWRGVLIAGPPGAGKSDLALRLLGMGWRLVSDDYSLAWASQGALFACAPPAIAGRIEVRGVGLVAVRRLTIARIELWIDCGGPPPERLPGPDRITIDGVDTPRLRLDVLEASAPAKVEAAMRSLVSGLGPGTGLA